MKKFLIVLLVLTTTWVVKLSYELFVLRASVTELSSNFELLQQQNASLNDNVVALKRSIAQQTTQATMPQQAVAAPTTANNDDTELVRQQLNLIEFALQQQQHSVALERLSQLQANIESYVLAPAIRDSLNNVLSKDQEMLKTFINTRVIQHNKINNLIHHMDREIQQELQVQHTAPTQHTTSFWQRFIQIESVKEPSAVLMQRGLVLKEAQLRLLIVQNTLQQGQQIPFQQALSAVAEVLAQLPDAKSQQWIKQLYQIKATPLTPTPHLNTRTLIG